MILKQTIVWFSISITDWGGMRVTLTNGIDGAHSNGVSRFIYNLGYNWDVTVVNYGLPV